MTTKREVEVRGPDVESAIKKGLEQLGITRSDVIVDVLDEGSRGLLGIGARDAVVRLSSMVVATPPPPKPAPTPKPAPPPTPTPVATPPTPEPAAKTAVSTPQTQPKPQPATIDDPELSQDTETATEVLAAILDHMDIEAEIVATMPETDNGRQMVVLQIVSDEDLSILIGPRGDTLGDLQYITRLISGNKLLRRTNISIDVQGYRERREQALVRLAQRMAEKAINRGEAVSMEAMPPNERRIIHMALRDHDVVYTNSVGEGNQRRVRIHLKQD